MPEGYGAGRVEIRGCQPSEFALVASWLSDPAINQWLYAEWRGREVDEKLIAITANGLRNQLWLCLIDEIAYGLVGLGSINQTDQSAVAWYLRGSGVQRRPGAMTACVQAAMHKAFDELKLHSVSASIRDGNEASERLLHSVGFRFVGTLREAFRDETGGIFLDRRQYDLLADDLATIESPQTEEN